jgi:hypothetical protein
LSSPATQVFRGRPFVADSFGQALAAADVNGDGYADVVIGAPNAGHGMVFVYNGSSTGLVANSTPTPSPDGQDGFGTVLGAAGDINEDGYGDVLAGEAAKVWLFTGSQTGLVSPSATSFAGTTVSVLR